MNKSLPIVSNSLVLLALFSCKFPLSSFTNEPIRISVIQDKFIIEWELSDSQIPDMSSSIDYYNVYFRNTYDPQWFFLSSTKGNETRIEAHILDFNGYGEYIIAVEGIRVDGQSSGITKSTDFNSVPSGGWYLVINR